MLFEFLKFWRYRMSSLFALKKKVFADSVLGHDVV